MIKRLIFWVGITTIILVVFGMLEEVLMYLANYFGIDNTSIYDSKENFVSYLIGVVVCIAIYYVIIKPLRKGK